MAQKVPRTKPRTRDEVAKFLRLPEAKTPESKKAPKAQYQYPCKACLKTPGSDVAQKKLCTASSHCKYHGGRYKCMLDERCKKRVAKEEASLKYKMENIPPGMTVRQVKEATAFLEEELDEITVEDVKQPCWQNIYCPQTIGLHASACYANLCERPHRAEVETWTEVVNKQEEYNTGKGSYTTYNHQGESEDDTSSEEGEE